MSSSSRESPRRPCRSRRAGMLRRERLGVDPGLLATLVILFVGLTILSPYFDQHQPAQHRQGGRHRGRGRGGRDHRHHLGRLRPVRGLRDGRGGCSRRGCWVPGCRRWPSPAPSPSASASGWSTGPSSATAASTRSSPRSRPWPSCGASDTSCRAAGVVITDEGWLELGTGTFLGIPHLILLLVSAFAVFGWAMPRTPFGRYAYAIGSNARLAPGRVRRGEPLAARVLCHLRRAGGGRGPGCTWRGPGTRSPAPH